MLRKCSRRTRARAGYYVSEPTNEVAFERYPFFAQYAYTRSPLFNTCEIAGDRVHVLSVLIRRPERKDIPLEAVVLEVGLEIYVLPFERCGHVAPNIVAHRGSSHPLIV